MAAHVTPKRPALESARLVTESTRPKQPPEQVSEFTTARLSLYLRCLDAFDTQGVSTVSSRGLAEHCQLNAALVRKDLAYFGEFGVRGVGYYVKDLKRHIKEILGLNRNMQVVIVGAGNLGLALADYPGFRAEGFDVVAMLDSSEAKVGTHSRGGVIVRHMRELATIVERDRIDIGIIAVPRDAAQLVADEIVATGVRAILNFARGNLRVPEHVKLKNVDLSVSLESLSFFLAQRGGQGA